jgi:hypothetical protein
VKSYLHYLWFRLRELSHNTAKFWKEDRESFLAWIWIFTSIGGCLGSAVFTAVNQTLGCYLTFGFFCELTAPILYWSRGYPIIMAFIWVVRLPISSYHWFQERLDNYKKWKETTSS